MPRKVSWDVRERALKLVLAGEIFARAGSLLGVSESVVKIWVRLAGMQVPRYRGSSPLTPVELSSGINPDRSYRRLSSADRAFIQAGLKSSLTQAEIARELGVHRSTVSNEIRRHQQTHWSEQHYVAEVAHHRAMKSRQRFRPGKLNEPELRRAVVERLNDKFSPQQITADLKKSYPDSLEMRVSHETIYQALYVQGAGALRHELTVEKALRSGRTGRKPKSKLPGGRGNKSWIEGARFTDRPEQARDRRIPGHWEGDLVVGPGNSGLITLIERRSRFTLIGKLPGSRDSETVIDVLQTMIKRLPEAVFETITWDQGGEMAQREKFTVATSCDVFFCDPHSPWQRPTNENTNGLIRDFYPKGTNFNKITDEDIENTVRLLNKRPRRVLDWDTPAERLSKAIDEDVALTT